MSADDTVSVTEYETRDPVAAHEFLSRTYGDHKVRMTGDRERFRLRVRRASVGGISANLVRHTMAGYCRTGPVHDLLAGHVRCRGVFTGTGRDRTRLERGDVCLYPVGVHFGLGWTELDLLFLSLPWRRVARSGHELAGIDPERVRFTAQLPVSPPLGRYWRELLIAQAGELLAEDSSMANPLLRDAAVRMLAAAVLNVFPNTAMEALDELARRGPGEVGPAALRRALQFIDANAHQEIGLTEIAEAAHVSSRALQYAFRRRLDTTPMAHLRKVRLEGAHQELLSADPGRGDTVTAIAYRWGFHHQGRFATLYRRAYGRPPVLTLRS